MKKLNNKGFAISTLIYGLAIMGIMIVAILMATMAQTRSNTSSLAKSIEEELNRFSKTETSFKGNDGPEAQEYIVPESGWYKIELWGTQGGTNGGKGAYTSGVIELEEGEVLYFYVGKQTSGSGKETDVRVLNGAYADEMSYETRIMVAAGGGSGTNADGGTLYGYNTKMQSLGGFIKSSGSDKDYSLLPATETGNYSNGTLTGINKDYEPSNAHRDEEHLNVTIPKPTGTNGGGDGFYPSAASNTGGASYIAGYAGAYGVIKGLTNINSYYQYYEHVYNTETDSFTYGDLKKTYYFVDGIMLPGVNSGDGRAKIERVLVKTDDGISLPRKNQKLNNVRYIKDCASGATPTLDQITWQKISAIEKGINRSGEKTLTYSTEGSSRCATIDLQGNYDLDEIAVFHKPVAGIDYHDNTIRVSSDGSNWQYIKKQGIGTNLSETETKTGIRVSAYQYDATTKLPDVGNYYIIPVLSENKVLTANNLVTIDYYKGISKQKFSIERITDGNINYGHDNEYKITELSKYKALQVTHGENSIGNTITAEYTFNKETRAESQIWRITPVENNTYIIETVLPGTNTGYLLPQTNKNVSDNLNQLIIGKNNAQTERFKLISIDYSSN